MVQWLKSEHERWHVPPVYRRRSNVWWKLGRLMILTVALCLAMIHIQTHAVMHDPSNLPPPLTLRLMLSNMYVTQTRGLIVAVLWASAAFVAFKVSRRQW